MNLMQKIYIGLFAILYLAVALVSTIHAVSFFGLANNDWMAIILAVSFELGQAAVLFSLLTSKNERGKIMPWVLMAIFTLVQVLGNVYSSYKHIITSSPENLRFFKEPIFIWTNLPDDQATVIVTYIVGAILPICALLLTSMVTNQFQNPNDSIIHLEDEDVQKNEEFKNNEQEQNIEHIEEKLENKEIENETIEDNISEKPIKESRFINSFK
jgi:predicted membrane channel-forming protein YqfA (hemolysin III family)